MRFLSQENSPSTPANLTTDEPCTVKTGEENDPLHPTDVPTLPVPVTHITQIMTPTAMMTKLCTRMPLHYEHDHKVPSLYSNVML